MIWEEVQYLEDEYDEMRKKVKRYETALERIAAIPDWVRFGFDAGVGIARKALGVEGCTGSPCTCTNGIGCTRIPLEKW